MNKPHLIVVCGILYPNPSPTGLCAYRYASLLADTYDIEFISLSSNGKEEKVAYEGFPVHTLTNSRLSLEHKSSGWLKQLIHRFGSIQLKFSLLGNLGWFAKSAYRKLEEIHRVHAIDALFTVCSPLPAHIAGVCFKEEHPEVRFCAYTVDPFAAKDRIVPIFHHLNDFVELERNVCNKADCLLLSEEALYSRSDIYGGIKHKEALPYMLPKSQQRARDRFDSEHIHCVYAGSFYRDIRNPEFMLKVISALKDNNIILHLYSSGCDNLVQQYISNNIQANGYVSQNELQQIYASCDILIGVGNAMNDFLPSKTYEYLSLRRPIVFFNPKGFENKVLMKYPHSLQISDDTDIEQAATLFCEFVSKEKGSTIAEEELYKLYESNTDLNIRKILLTALNQK